MNEIRHGGADFSASEALYARMLLDNSPNPIFMFDEELRLIAGTRHGLSEVFTSGETSGITFRELFSHVFPDEWVSHACGDCESCLETVQSFFYEEQLGKGNGNLYIQVRISSVADDEGQIRGVMATINDITEFAVAREQAMEASRAKSLFLTNMSHEVRTPMNAIKGLSELLMLTKLDAAQKDYAGNIVSASETLLKIINDILDFTKLDGNKIEIVNSTYDTASFLEDIANMAGLRTADKRLSFITEIEPSLPSMLKGDNVRLKQVLVNLVSNAVKYTREGYVKLSVSSRKDGDGVRLSFTVEDTGTGISSEKMSALFNAFKHDEAKSARTVAGAGLGLIICRELVQLMGGEISVESELGKGSAFTFWVPQEIVSDEMLAMVNLPERKRVLLLHEGVKGANCADILRRLFVSFDYCQSSMELEALEMSGSYTHCIYSSEFARDIEQNKSRIGDCMLISIRDISVGASLKAAAGISVLFEPVLITGIARVLNRENYSGANADKKKPKLGKFSVEGVEALIVDDNEVNLIVGGEILRQYGMEAEEADSGALAVEMCGLKKYDIIFMDHMMPEMDGVETTQAIRSGGGINSKTPIVALTANAVTGMKEYFLDCEMNDFISKPIDIEEMNRILLEWLPEEKIVSEEVEEESAGGEADAEEDDPVIARLEAMGIKSSEALRRLEGNKVIYKAVLETFTREIHKQSDNLKALAESENWKDFQTEAHGLKGALANIGARDLSLIARNMEMAHRENNLSYVREYLDDFVSDLNILGQKLNMLIASEKPVRKRKQGGAPDIAETLAKVGLCLEYLENEEAMELLEQISGSSDDESVNEKIEGIMDRVSVFDYDGAAEIIAELTAS